ncbi:MarR family winged helix-turn-helix transcriptional regulator [Streptomyces sp. NPDC002454]|jgi:DNA-binding MarR family transcriptional regulator|uniref:MarR family winged helix-turn-helix transcriptional regulator n=1 Tax=Streptomyces sp. NPDC002490 TaxID=3154416 RepID=UPI00332B5189
MGTGVDEKRKGAPPGDADGAAATAGGSPGAADAAERVRAEFPALERELTVFLRRARAASGEIARAVHPELEPGAYGLLVRLDESGVLRATDLAGYVGVGKATMSRQLKALESLGLVSREPDPADGRASLIRLTDTGRTRVHRVREARRARYVSQLTDWSPAEVAELARLLHRLNESTAG